jgi:hypothetical protein
VTWTSIERGRATSAVQYSLDIETIRMASRDIATMTSRYDAVLLPTLPQGTRPLGFYDMSLDIGGLQFDLHGRGQRLYGAVQHFPVSRPWRCRWRKAPVACPSACSLSAG